MIKVETGLAVKLEINDIFGELLAENRRLLYELKFSDNLREVLQKQRNYLINSFRNHFNNGVNCGPNEDIISLLDSFDTELTTALETNNCPEDHNRPDCHVNTGVSVND